MLTNAEKVRSSRFAIDEAAHTIRFERLFTAKPQQVFAAWTQPEQVACWWDANGERLLACDIDLKVGGAFRFVSIAAPERPFAGTYKQLSPPELIEFDALGSLGRVSLKPTDGGTHMIVEIACANAAHLKQFVAMGVHKGTTATLDNLVGYLERAY